MEEPALHFSTIHPLDQRRNKGNKDNLWWWWY